MSVFCPPFLSSHSQTAQDISFANVQALFQSLSSSRGCPTTSQLDTEAEEPPPQPDRKSVTVNGKWLLMVISKNKNSNKKTKLTLKTVQAEVKVKEA